MQKQKASRSEIRVLRLGIALVLVGCTLTWVLFGYRAAVSFMAGGLLSTLNLLWLWLAVKAMVFTDPGRSKPRLIAGFLLRLLLIPLTLYAMIRFLFLNVPAAVAGLAVFSCSVFVEGVLEARERTSRKNARVQ